MTDAPDQHVAIIGGGIIGCATAYYLTCLGHRNVTIFEQTDIACHSSGKAGGFLARKWCDETDMQGLARTSFELHLELADKFPDLDYRLVDTYEVVTKSEEVRTETENPMKWLNGNVQRVRPLSTSSDTAKVSPKPLCNKLLGEGKKAGANVVMEKVTDIIVENTRITQIQTPKQTIAVDVVVIAAGPWSTSFIQKHLPLYPIPALPPQTRAHSVVLEVQDTGLEMKQCVFQYHHTGTKVVDPEIYPCPNSQVYVCGEVDTVPLPELPDQILPDLDKCEELVAQVGYAASVLKSARVLARQACYLPGSKDSLPLIGRVPGYGNVLVGTGHTFWGILNAPVTGKCLAELIVQGNATSCDISPFDPARFL